MEDAQLNGFIPEEFTQQTGHAKSYFFNACCTDMNKNMLHVSSGFDIKKEDCVVLCWNIEVNYEECPLVENNI